MSYHSPVHCTNMTYVRHVSVIPWMYLTRYVYIVYVILIVLLQALLNLGSSDPSLRSAAYNLLCVLTQTFDLQIEDQLLETSGLCIPNNNTLFIKHISEKLAANVPRLTLEFLEECIQGCRNSNIEMKHLCLEYMTPWLPNLAQWVVYLSFILFWS